MEAKLRGKTIWYEEFADTIACAAVGKIFFNRRTINTPANYFG